MWGGSGEQKSYVRREQKGRALSSSIVAGRSAVFSLWVTHHLDRCDVTFVQFLTSPEALYLHLALGDRDPLFRQKTWEACFQKPRTGTAGLLSRRRRTAKTIVFVSRRTTCRPLHSSGCCPHSWRRGNVRDLQRYVAVACRTGRQVLLVSRFGEPAVILPETAVAACR